MYVHVQYIHVIIWLRSHHDMHTTILLAKVLSTTLPLVVQHWFVLTKYIHPKVYIVAVLIVEILWYMYAHTCEYMYTIHCTHRCTLINSMWMYTVV